MNNQLHNLALEVSREIEDILLKGGILCRVFSRGKSTSSLKKKIDGNPGKYNKSSHLIQDAVGIRVVVYFQDDIEVVQSLLTRNFAYDAASSAIDLPDKNSFRATRHNLIFRLSDVNAEELAKLTSIYPIDSCFEVQIRSMLSEGWHEVEHDLRYKCIDFWSDHDDLSRALNGVIATLETSEWSMSRIFDALSYRHYKNSNWPAMLHTRLRIRTKPTLDPNTAGILTACPKLAKRMSRIDRVAVIHHFEKLRPQLVPSLDNACYIWNLIAGPDGNRDLQDSTPSIIIDAFKDASLESVTS